MIEQLETTQRGPQGQERTEVFVDDGEFVGQRDNTLTVRQIAMNRLGGAMEAQNWANLRDQMPVVELDERVGKLENSVAALAGPDDAEWGESPMGEETLAAAVNAFWYSSLSGTSVTIGQGHLIFHRKGAWLAPAATVTLSGTGNVFVYATATKTDPSDFAISATSLGSMPSSSTNQWVFPLHMFNSADAATYTWVTNLLAGQAIQLGAPI